MPSSGLRVSLYPALSAGLRIRVLLSDLRRLSAEAFRRERIHSESMYISTDSPWLRSWLPGEGQFRVRIEGYWFHFAVVLLLFSCFSPGVH